MSNKIQLRDLIKLFDSYLKIVKEIKKINKTYIAAGIKISLKQIQIPSQISEGFAEYILVKKIIKPFKQFNPEKLKRNVKRFDFQYDGKKNIEVKATGTKGFQRLRKKALGVHLILWLDFSESINSNRKLFTIYYFKPCEVASKNDRKKHEKTIELKDLPKNIKKMSFGILKNNIRRVNQKTKG